MTTPALVVSIHDVSPLTRDSVTRILAALSQAGIPRVSLLVVPDHHHRGNITADPDFGPWLRDQVAAGHEAALHGYLHQRERRPHESAYTRFFTRLYTAGEGEFFDIAYPEARAILTRGREELAQVSGAIPTGFIAPAWLLSPEGEQAARDLGFAYTTRIKAITHLPTGHQTPSQSLCWSIRQTWRRTVSLAWNRLLFHQLTTNPLLRISIHPPDIAHPAIWRQIKSLATKAAEHRTPIPYQTFISPERSPIPT